MMAASLETKPTFAVFQISTRLWGPLCSHQ